MTKVLIILPSRRPLHDRLMQRNSRLGLHERVSGTLFFVTALLHRRG